MNASGTLTHARRRPSLPAAACEPTAALTVGGAIRETRGESTFPTTASSRRQLHRAHIQLHVWARRRRAALAHADRDAPTTARARPAAPLQSRRSATSSRISNSWSGRRSAEPSGPSNTLLAIDERAGSTHTCSPLIASIPASSRYLFVMESALLVSIQTDGALCLCPVVGQGEKRSVTPSRSVPLRLDRFRTVIGGGGRLFAWGSTGALLGFSVRPPDVVFSSQWTPEVYPFAGCDFLTELSTVTATGIYAIGSCGTLLHLPLTSAPPATPPTFNWRASPSPWRRQTLEGYCWPLSVESGDEITFYANAPTGCNVALVDLVSGRYHSLDRWQGHDACIAPTVQDTRRDAALAGAGWTPTLTLTTPPLPSSLYALELSAGRQTHYILFVVRQSSAALCETPLTVHLSTNTWNAYNWWGGHPNMAHGSRTSCRSSGQTLSTSPLRMAKTTSRQLIYGS